MIGAMNIAINVYIMHTQDNALLLAALIATVLDHGQILFSNPPAQILRLSTRVSFIQTP